MEDESVSGDAIRFEIGGGGCKNPLLSLVPLWIYSAVLHFA